MQEKVIQVALLGLGTVGGGVYRIIKSQAGEMVNKLGAKLEIKRILVRDLEKARRRIGDDPALTADWKDIITDPQIAIVIEVMGGIEPAHTYISEALSAGKHVVTANKDLIAQSSEELIRLAQKNHTDLKFEAAVAGGIPIIGPLQGALTANHITEVMGIVNGTTNFILSSMTDEGMDFSQALAIAQEKGFAEADPTADVDGLDAGRKVAIMASLAFNSRVTFDDVYTEGIRSITAKDIRYAEEFGRVIKLIGIARQDAEGIEARVHPMLIRKTHPLATVSGSFNAVFLHGDAVDDVMFYGRGAGDLPTGSAIMGDVFEITKDIVNGSSGKTRDLCYKHIPVKKIEESVSRFYLRMEVEDKPGVLATLTSVLGNNAVSIRQIVQKDHEEEGAEIVIITDYTKERHIMDALLTFDRMSMVRTKPMVLRVY